MNTPARSDAAGTREPLAVELLASDHARRCLDIALDSSRPMPASASEDHEDFLRNLAADPMIERYGRPRKESQAARTLALLDSLERSGR